MTLDEASKKWGISGTTIKKLIVKNDLPFDIDNIPNNINGIVVIDRRYSGLKNLELNHDLLLLIIFIKFNFYFNYKLLGVKETFYNMMIDDLLSRELISKSDEYLYELTVKGLMYYLTEVDLHSTFIKSLLGSAKINHVILDKLKSYL